MTAFGHAQQWSAWLTELVGKPHVRALEVGSNEGDSATWLLDNVLTGDGSSITCVDCWSEETQERTDPELRGRLPGPIASAAEAEAIFDRRVAPYELRVNKLKGWSAEWLPKLPKATYDLIYIDGTHDAPSVLQDSVLAWPLARPGAIVIWDDYQWPLGSDATERPKIAIDAFTAVYARQLELLSFPAWQVAARKR